MTDATCGRILSGVLFVECLCVGVDVLSAFLDGSGRCHHAVLGAQNCRRGVYAYLLRVSAGEDLEPGGAEQKAACECCKFVYLSSSVI